MEAGRPLTTTFAPGAFRGLTIKGSTDPFVNLPPISGLVSSAALQEQARSQFGMMLALDEYRLRDTAPIPAPGDREGYYGPDHAEYWLSGLVDWLAVAAQGARYGLGPRLRYFELGCGSGRVVRHGAAHESGLDISCCDINKRHTEWVRLFLPGHIKVFHSTILPTLPLADNMEGDLYNATVFHAAEYIHREWGRLFAAVEIVPRGHFYQDVVLLRK
jgi:SAM-dependent methyltransferase